MKTHPSSKQLTTGTNAFRRVTLTACAALALAGLATTGKANNVLQNPGFENASTMSGWSVVSPVSWNINAASTQLKLYHSGNNAMWTQGVYNGGANLTYAYQTIACAPGSTFTADAYFSQFVSHSSTISEGGDAGTSGLFTSDGSGQQDAWIEVVFLDANNNILSDYRSVILDPTYVNNLASSGDTATNDTGVYLSWVDAAVTNQYDVSQIVANADPDTFPAAITNTLASGQYMVAPVGTKNVQFRISLFQALYEAGATYWDDADLDLVGGPAPSAIGSVTPDGSQFFNQSATNFSFTITSASSGGAPLPNNPQNGVTVTVNGTNESSQLQFSGTPTAWNVSLPGIASNQLYSISITVSNDAGLVTTSSSTFDTFPTNTFVVSTEDYDFNGGQFIQNPVPTTSAAANSYWGTAGTLGIDQSCAQSITSGGTTMAPAYPNRTDGNVAFQVASDIQLPLYEAQNNPNVYNVAISYNGVGDWLNYTRNPYPQGNYYVYARISGGAGYGVEYLNMLTSGYGTSTQTTNNIGQFVLPNGVNWGAYQWIPLTTSSGGMAVVTIPSGQQTLQLLSGGGENVVDFIFVPTSATPPPTVGNWNPPIGTLNQNVFVSAANLTYTVSSTTSTIAQNNVKTYINGVNVSGTATFTGSSANWTVSVPLPQNQLINLQVIATDATGTSSSVTETFDTFSQNNYMFEAEDFDFNGGQFIDNPIPTGNANFSAATVATNSYFYWPADITTAVAIPGVDDSCTNADNGETYVYRPQDPVGTQVASDYLRLKFDDNTSDGTNSDYNVGWWNQGEWMNYTRTYPTGNFHVYGRLAGGVAYTGLTLSQVTSGVGTSTQATTVLGTFADPTANGWQTWHWVPLLDTNGQMVTVSLGGVETLRATAGTGANANFYMLVATAPVIQLGATTSGKNLLIQFATQSGSTYTLLSSSTAGGSWQPVVNASSIAGTGSPITVTNAIGSGSMFYRLKVQ